MLNFLFIPECSLFPFSSFKRFLLSFSRFFFFIIILSQNDKRNPRTFFFLFLSFLLFLWCPCSWLVLKISSSSFEAPSSPGCNQTKERRRRGGQPLVCRILAAPTAFLYLSYVQTFYIPFHRKKKREEKRVWCRWRHRNTTHRCSTSPLTFLAKSGVLMPRSLQRISWNAIFMQIYFLSCFWNFFLKGCLIDWILLVWMV